MFFESTVTSQFPFSLGITVLFACISNEISVILTEVTFNGNKEFGTVAPTLISLLNST